VTATTSRVSVVDASVAVKLVLDEPLSEQAHRLYAASVRRGRRLLAPSLLPNEVTNAIYRRLRRGDLSEASADDAIARFARSRFQLLAPADLAQKAYAFAKRHQLGAIYDSLHVVLARDLGADLWTDDRTLLNGLAAAAPWVRWIGDYPPAGA
jgi:predicted nucleic acid-binding protein